MSVTLTYDIETAEDPRLKKSEVKINGKIYDLSKTGQKVRVAGPRDELTCERCLPWVGRILDRKSPAAQPFREGGLHPHCRHYLVPVGMPGLDKEVARPGIEFIDDLITSGDRASLNRIYGKEKADRLLKEEVGVSDLYRPDGTVKSLSELDKTTPNLKRDDVIIKEQKKLALQTAPKTIDEKGKISKRLPSEPPEPVKETVSAVGPHPFEEYQAEMERKYGKDKMILEMEEDELDKLQSLERDFWLTRSKKVSKGDVGVSVADEIADEIDDLKPLGGGRSEEDFVFHRGKDPRDTSHISLFADDRANILQYGDDMSEYAIPRAALEDVPDFVVDHASKHYGISRDEALALLNPDDIVDTAGAWDDPDYVRKMWSDFEDYWLEQRERGIVGIRTSDGAAIFPGPDLDEKGLLGIATL